MDVAFLDWLMRRSQSFQTARPIYREANKQPQAVAQIITREIREVIEELNQQGGGQPVSKATAIELLDVIFPVMNGVESEGELGQLDPHQIVSRANGQGNRSGVFDQMLELAGRTGESKTITQALPEITQLFTLCVSAWNHMFLDWKPIPLAREKMEVNAANYWAEFFSSTGANGRPLTAEEQLAKYEHVFRALRLVRQAYGRPPAGLLPKHYLPHAVLIQDYRNSADALKLLTVELESKHK